MTRRLRSGGLALAATALVSPLRRVAAVSTVRSQHRRRRPVRRTCRSSSRRPATRRRRPSRMRPRRSRPAAATRSRSRRRRTSPSSSVRPSPVVRRRTCSTSTPSRFADYASVGALEPYGSKVPDVNDFYPSLRNAFTYKGQLYCIPKDFSTLALEINTDLWAKAHLTDADIPTTWDQLMSVSQKLKAAGIKPLATADTRDRLGRVHGRRPVAGWSTRTAPRRPPIRPQNVQALQYVQELLKQGLAVLPEAARRRLGRRGVRQGQDGDGNGRQLDRGRDEDRLPEHQVRREAAAGRTGRPGHAVLHAVLGDRRQEQVQGPGDQVRRGDDGEGPAVVVREGVRRHAVPAVGQGPTIVAQFPNDAAFIDGAPVSPRVR